MMKRVEPAAAVSPNRLTVLMTLFIGVVFLWTSSAYLTWTSHLSPLAEAPLTYMATEVYGALAQAAGLALFVLLLRYDRRVALRSKIFPAVMALDGLSILPMLLSDQPAAIVVWGMVMNLFHGAVAGYYVALLACRIPKNRRGFCFGVGYAIGNVGSRLLSLPENSLSPEVEWAVLAAFIALSLVLLFLLDRDAPKEDAAPRRITRDAVPGSTCLLAGAIIFLLALTNQFLFFFPAQAYLADTAILHFSHVFYAAGLVIAALVNDKKRVAGLTLAVLSLCFPLLSISLYRFAELLTLLSVLGYLVTGFYSVYRIVVFADLYDEDSGALFLAPAGLLFGKAGEGIGAALGPAIGDNQVLLAVLTAVFFAAVIILAYLLYVRLYSVKPATTLGDRTERFYRQYDISSREQQVFLLLAEGKTNPDIAGALNISENTVKFHIKNILKKTSCANRAELLALFKAGDVE